MSRLRLVLSVALLLLWAAPAGAMTVAIVWPPGASDDVKQVLTLLRGELLSVGLEVTTSDGRGTGSGEPSGGVAWLEGFAARGASAVIDAVGEETSQAIDVWILKAHPQRFEVTHVAVEPGMPKQPETLALRALEALRAGLLQIDWAARKRREQLAQPAPPTVPAAPAPAPERPRERVALEVGAVAGMSLDGVGPTISPMVRVGWAARPSLLVHASAEGFGTRGTVSTASGGAKVAQQSAVVGAAYRLRPAQRVWPFVSLAAGVLHTSVDGEAGWGTSAGSAEQWSKLLDVGLGAGLALHSRFYMTLSLHAQLLEPYVAIHIVDSAAATSGRPNLLLALTVGAWL